jgi:hypothetical protein
MIPSATVRFFQELHAINRPRKDSFYQGSTERRRRLFAGIKDSRNRLLDDLFARVADVRPESEQLRQVRLKLYDYYDRSDWALLDLVALAACTTATVEDVCDAIAPNALLYHSLRMLDDVLDAHHDYKGGARTLFGELSLNTEPSHLASHANLIPAMMMMAGTSATLAAEDRRLLERTLIGMLHESFPGNWRSPESYRQIAAAKMGAYGLFLYRPVLLMFDSATRDTLEPFLVRSFLISQFLNDLQDQRDDEAREQPNYWLMGRDPQVSIEEFRREIEAYAGSCAGVPHPARDYAHARVTDSIGYLLQVIEINDQSRNYRTVPSP